MKFIFERKEDHWKVEFSTSSSKEVYRYIVQAGSATLPSNIEPTFTCPLSRAEAATVADSSEKEAYTLAHMSSKLRLATPPLSSPQRDSRCKTLRKRVTRAISHIGCAYWSDRTKAEERRVVPAFVHEEFEHRKVFELFGSDVRNTPGTPLPKYFECNSQLPVEMYSPPQPMLQRRGAQRGGVPPGRRFSSTRTTGSHSLQPGLVGNVYSGRDAKVDRCAVHTDQVEAPWRPNGTAYADNTASVNNVDMVPRTTTHGFPSLGLLTCSFPQALPELSPQSATLSSATISPETPVMTGYTTRVVSPESNTSLAYRLSPSGNATVDMHPYSGDMCKVFDLQTAPSFIELEGSIIGQHDDDLRWMALVEYPDATNQQKFDFNHISDWSETEPVALLPEMQHFGSLPPPIPFIGADARVERDLSECFDPPAKDWGQQVYENRACAYDYQPADFDDLGIPTQANVRSNSTPQCLEGGDDETEFNFSSSSEASFIPKKKYPSVKCDCCGKTFTGQYARGNMRRHASRMNPLKPQQDINCRICKTSFNRSDGLRAHDRRFHSNR